MTNDLAPMRLVPSNITEAKQFAEEYSKSILVPKEYQGKPANCLVAMMWGFELGLGPLTALKSISVINGRPAVWGDALLGICMQHPQYLSITETSEGDGENYTAICNVERLRKDGETATTEVKFSVADAKRAGLLGKGGPWSQYPQRMMRYRARGFALRDAFPDALAGVITAEEAKDMPAIKTVQPADVTIDRGGSARAEAALKRIASDDAQFVDAPKPSAFVLAVPTKPDRNFDNHVDFAQTYNDLLLAIRQHEKTSHAERRTKMRELFEANADSLTALAEIDADLAEELKTKRLAYNAGLASEERQAHGK